MTCATSESSGPQTAFVSPARSGGGPRYRAYGRRHIRRIRQLVAMPRERRIGLEVASAVLPFRVNDYVLDELIDWTDVPDDPIFQLTFPRAEMLDHRDFVRLQDLIRSGADAALVARRVAEIQMRMNPHPAGQLDLNIPVVNGWKVSGCQHKYRETVLVFPKAGQTCHAFCTYCFRWPQFAGIEGLRLVNDDIDQVVGYLRGRPEVTDVLITGGDPLVMSTSMLRRVVEPLLTGDVGHLTSIRIGTKALAYWPYRFTTDADADDLMRLFEKVRESGRQLALMAHFSHPRELGTEAARRALRRVENTGAVVRCQAPLVRHVNDRAELWGDLWREQVRLGAVPYYMFVQRDTGPRAYFEVPLATAHRIFVAAARQVSGLGRTVRGPVMSARPGKILIDGVAELEGERVFVLKMIQGRDPSWAGRVFFARYDPTATWLDDLEPAFGETEFFFEPALRDMAASDWRSRWWGDLTGDEPRQA